MRNPKKGHGGYLMLGSAVQAALFELEVSGQISDGHWENASPREHWVDWVRCGVEVVDPDKVGRNFYPERASYGLTSKELLGVVGHRMVGIARLTLAGFDREQVRKLEYCICLETGKWLGVDHWRYADGTGEDYWRPRREEVAGYLEEARAAYEGSGYGFKELRKDLLEVKRAMMTYRARP